MVRSRRRSTRLIGEAPQDARVKQSNTHKRRHSNHDTSAATSKNASREGSCPQLGSNSKVSSHDPHLATPDTHATTAVTKVEDEGPTLPLFPNLRASSERAAKGNVITKWVKTARGSIRLASDSPAEGVENNSGKVSGVLEGHNASPATFTRRSRRLKSMTPDAGEETGVGPMASQHTTSKTGATASPSGAHDPAGFDAEQESGPDWQDPSIRATTEHNPTTDRTHHENTHIHDEKLDRLPQESDTLEDTSPIPELVADIEKIIQASPIADPNLANHGTKRKLASTQVAPLKKRAHANMTTRSRTLRSSSRSVESLSEIGKRPSSEQTDSESSQLDGAFNDSIRGRRKKKVWEAGSTANTPKPRTPHGTKRSMEELSLDGGNVDTPGHRQRRRLDSDESKPEVDLSSANPMETATSQYSSSIGSPRPENQLENDESARRSDEPANPVLLAQTISANQDTENCDIDSIAADDGSQGASHRQSPEGSPEGGAHKCADCGRSPERYLVCAKCQAAIYCGKYCQIWNWPLHTTYCLASDDADHGEIELQEAYLGGLWAAALKGLKVGEDAGGTLESMLLGEAARHSPTLPTFMGQGRFRGSGGFDVGTSHLAPRDPESMDTTRTVSVRLAQATLGSYE